MLSAALAIAFAEPVTTWDTVKKEKKGEYSIFVQIPRLAPTSALNRFANLTVDSRLRRRADAFLKEAQLEIREAGKPRTPLTLEAKPQYTYIGPDFVSVWIEEYVNFNAAYPTLRFKPINIGLMSGKPKELALSLILSEDPEKIEEFHQMVMSDVRAEMRRRQTELKEDYPLRLMTAWHVSKNGLTISFAPEELGPRVIGSFVFKYPWKRVAPFLDPQGPAKNFLKS